MEIAGIGSIKVKIDDGMIHTILDIQHVKGLKKNLLSMGQLDDLRYEFHAKRGIMKVIRETLVVMKAEKIDANLHMLHERTYQEAKTYITKFREELKIMWHHKLSHMSKNGLKILSKQELLFGLKFVSLPFCEHCVINN